MDTDTPAAQISQTMENTRASVNSRDRTQARAFTIYASYLGDPRSGQLSIDWKHPPHMLHGGRIDREAIDDARAILSSALVDLVRDNRKDPAETAVAVTVEELLKAVKSFKVDNPQKDWRDLDILYDWSVASPKQVSTRMTSLMTHRERMIAQADSVDVTRRYIHHMAPPLVITVRFDLHDWDAVSRCFRAGVKVTSESESAQVITTLNSLQADLAAMRVSTSAGWEKPINDYAQAHEDSPQLDAVWHYSEPIWKEAATKVCTEWSKLDTSPYKAEIELVAGDVAASPV